MTRQFVPLPDKLVQVLSRENIASRRFLAHQPERAAICAAKTALPKDSATIDQSRAREIIKRKRDYWRFQLHPALPLPKTLGHAALERRGQV